MLVILTANCPASAMNPLIRKIWPLAVLVAVLVAGCQPRDGRAETKERELMHTSFEEMVGWAPAPPPSPAIPPSLSTVKAHTGKYAMRVDSANAYSFSYRASLGSLCSTHRPRRLTLGAWVWVPRFEDTAVLVFALSDPNNPDQPLLSKYVYLTDSGPFGKWKYVSRAIDLPGNIHSNTQVVIYLWRANAAQPVYADDLQLTELW